MFMVRTRMSVYIQQKYNLEPSTTITYIPDILLICFLHILLNVYICCVRYKFSILTFFCTTEVYYNVLYQYIQLMTKVCHCKYNIHQ